MSSTETLVRELADRAELAELAARHGKWVDGRDWNAASAIATEDITVRARGMEVNGIEAYAKVAREIHEAFDSTRHSIGNLIIDLHGDSAEIDARLLAVFLHADGSMTLTTADYHFGARRTEEGWRIATFDVDPTARTVPIELVD